MANEFIKNHNSFSPDLNDYGKEFPLFLEKHAENPLLYLADVARLEWALQCAFNAPDFKQLDFKKLKEIEDIDADLVFFLLPPGSTLLDSSYPLLQIWNMHQSELNQETLELPQNKHFYFFVWRNQLDIRIEELTKNQWYLLSLINQKTPLEKISRIMPEQELLTLLADFTQNKWLSDFKIGVENVI